LFRRCSSTNKPERFRPLEVETVSDTFVDCGPLASIHAAMRRAVHRGFRRRLRQRGLDADVIRFCSRDRRRRHRRAALGARHRAAAHDLRRPPPAAGRTRSRRPPRARDFLPRVRVDYVAEDELGHIRGTARSMLNVNTPEELAAVGGSLDDA
jgi:hypothetical protein